ncbi:alpha-1,6- mannosyltransferase [Coemansia sp. RSA 2599]|nr:alpha-1,6- mannosyltransferase [Coemansia sp. RSA 2598]KAJ1820963.1 alpha-1,6- mannosyltransferase [Coemansia sp. RSA 2599]
MGSGNGSGGAAGRAENPPKQLAPASSSGAQRFVAKQESVEARLKQSTIGLVQLSDFQRIKNELEEERQREAAQTLIRKRPGQPDQQHDAKKKKSRAKRKGAQTKLSFSAEDEDDEDDGGESGGGGAEKAVRVAGRKKNPAVDTSFLPDKQRDEEEARVREELRQKWLADQEKMKQEPVDITYSYWDGTGHRRRVRCRKGDTIAQFLDKCRRQVPDLRNATVDGLLYIKEDLIIPHHYSFYDLIISKARGKSGPLFSFDVHDDVRLANDASVEKDETHAGKVCERTWYERNKHIFPASRWEIFDPQKDYGTYTIRGSGSQSK